MHNHAGTTPMNMRKDAGKALLRVYQQIETRFPLIVGKETVWTIGQILFHPGAPSVVPGEAEMILQIRDPHIDKLEELKNELKAIIAKEKSKFPCNLILNIQSEISPVAMDPTLQKFVESSAKALAPKKYLKMASGAGHDARTISQILPTAMMFIPSIGGISHHHHENSTDEDIELGSRVYGDAAAMMMSGKGKL